MKVFVYGTLKRGHGNNRCLQGGTFLIEGKVQGYKLHYSSGGSGFPVASPSKNDLILGEIWDIGDNKDILARLDRLEGYRGDSSSMYLREEVEVWPEEPEAIAMTCSMYIGNPVFWPFSKMKETTNDDGLFSWP